MAKTDWQMGDTVQPEDMNQIGQEINELREDVDNIEVPPASTEQAGIVQLSNAIDSISETMAATPKAVKQAYDQAVQAFQLGNEKKQDLVDALIAIGVPASTSESWDDLLGKVASVIRATGDASVGDVLSGKTFSNASANGLTGTMPNRGAVNPNLTNQGQQYTIPAGYHNGAGKVTANISNLTAGNVRSGATVGGVAGTFSQFSNGATAAQILTGRSAAVNGQVVNGTMADRAGNQPAQDVRARNNTILGLRPQNAGYYPAGTGNWLEWEEPNWKPENIRAGVSMFGKVGTLVEGVSFASGSFNVQQNQGVIQVRNLDFRPDYIFGYVDGDEVTGYHYIFVGKRNGRIKWRIGMYDNPNSQSGWPTSFNAGNFTNDASFAIFGYLTSGSNPVYATNDISNTEFNTYANGFDLSLLLTQGGFSSSSANVNVTWIAIGKTGTV